MPDDTNDRGGQDRARVSGNQDYEVRYFAEKNGMSVERARELIDRHGNSREKLEEEARKLKGGG